MADFQSIEAAVKEIQKQRKAIDARIEKAKAERDELAAAPLNNEDAMKVIAEALDRDGGDAPRRLAHLVESVRSRPLKGELADAWAYAMPGRERIGYMLVSLLSEPIKTAIADVVAQMDEPEHVGAPIGERKKRIAALDKQIEAAEGELAELRAQAKRAGISLKGAPL